MIMKRTQFFISALATLLLSGCGTNAHSPTVEIVGSYFPAWIVCIVLGLVLTLIARQIFIGLKLDTHLHPIALVYLCLMIAFTLAIWLLIFQN